MTYEYRTPGRDWRMLMVDEGASFADVFRALGAGAEVRCVYASPRWQDVATVTGAASEGSVGARLDGLDSLVNAITDSLMRAAERESRAMDRAGRILDRLRDLEHKWTTLSERVADAEESLARARVGSLEALEARVSQLEAVREMGVRTW